MRSYRRQRGETRTIRSRAPIRLEHASVGQGFHGKNGLESTGSAGSGATSSAASSSEGGDFEIVAINDLGDAKTMAHLLKYDSVLGPLDGGVAAEDGVDQRRRARAQVLSERDPGDLPWRTSASTS